MAKGYFKHNRIMKEERIKNEEKTDPLPDSFSDSFPDSYDTYKIEDIVEDLSTEVTSGVNLLTDIFNLLQNELGEIKDLLTELRNYYYEEPEEEKSG